LKDRRVPFRIKLIPLAAFLYLIFPVDFIPDLFAPVFGYADDLAVLIFSFSLFIRFSPQEVVAEHVAAMRES
tara:strand:+ start:401 stop:616 length:216 start_codon:yes stop_codon:yes gene_type:complete